MTRDEEMKAILKTMLEREEELKQKKLRKKEYDKIYFEKNRKRHSEYNRRYYQEHREEILRKRKR